MATDKTESKKEILNRLFQENGLLAEDVHKHNHYTIITRAGIEKIQAKNKVSVHYESVVMERDFCVIKGVFHKDGVPDLETFGSASKETSQNKYYPEMAEKRCLSRGVLKICRFYELGVFGEDEADDFKQKQEPAKAHNITAENANLYVPDKHNPTNNIYTPPKPDPEKLATAKAALTISKPEPKTLEEMQDEFKELMQNDVFTDEEREKALEPLMGYDAIKLAKVIAGTEKLIEKRRNVAA